MSVIFDWLLIIVSTFMTIKSFNRIINNRNSSLANYIVLVVYVFCCIPILFNYVLGIPEYNTIYWYKCFCAPMNNHVVGAIYDIYILLCIVLLYIYARYFDIYVSNKKELVHTRSDFLVNNYLGSVVIISSPLLYILITGNLSAYSIYGISKDRGIDSNQYTLVLNMLVLVSIYVFCEIFFKSKLTKYKILMLLLYSLIIAWIQGKRFIIALMALIYFFYISKSKLEKKQRKRLKKGVPIIFWGLVCFFYFYLVVVRPLSNTGFQSVYEMLRVDLGRDDVIKFVIYKTLFQDEKIVDYPGQTFLSTFFAFIPRSIWPSKPYPHYRYLTSAILNLPITSLPAGTTPSWYEMCIANFGDWGFGIGIITIPLFCMCLDRIKVISEQMIGLILITVLLTQSMDAYLIFVLVYIVQVLIRCLVRKKRVRLIWRK